MNLTQHIHKEQNLFKTNSEVAIKEAGSFPNQKLMFDKLKVDSFNWITLGTFICDLHKKLIENEIDLTTNFSLNEFIRISATCETNIYIEGLTDLSPDELSKEADEPMEIVPEKSMAYEIHSSANGEDEDMIAVEIQINGPSEGNTDNESKPAHSDVPIDGQVTTLKEDNKRRRRGSDLTNLEQWGWHKNRRSKRKKVEDEIELVDSTLNGFLKRILSSHFLQNFNECPFGNLNEKEEEKPFYDPEKQSLEEFQKRTKILFEQLINELCQSFDLVDIVTKYCNSLSSLWNNFIPTEVRNTFMIVFKMHL